MDIYFKNIRLIDPATERDERLNVRILNGNFVHLSTQEAAIDSATQIIEAENLIMCPGFLDIHVHLREPGQEHKETIKTGTDAAANGGFTGVLCMPNTSPDIDDVAVVEYIKNKSKGLPVDVLISAAITKKRKGEELTNMSALNEAGVSLFTDDGTAVHRSDIMKLAFELAAPGDLLLSQHCEDKDLTGNFTMNESELSFKLGLKGYPRIAEEIIVDRDVRLAAYCGNRRYHAQHLSTKGAVEIIRNAKMNGQRVTCEAAPHHFVLTEDNMQTFDSNYKMNPPLRQHSDIDAIIEGFKDGTIDCIATDHAPHALNEKHVELECAANGIIGLETALGLSMTYLVYKNHITVNRLIELMAINPRKIINMPHVEFIENSKANVTVFNPEEEWTVDLKKFKSKSVNSPFEGFLLKGKPKYIINNNKFVECNL